MADNFNLTDAPMINAGIVTTLTSKFFSEYKKDVMDLFVEKLNDFKLADATPDYNLGVFKLYLALTN